MLQPKEFTVFWDNFQGKITASKQSKPDLVFRNYSERSAYCKCILFKLSIWEEPVLSHVLNSCNLGLLIFWTLSNAMRNH